MEILFSVPKNEFAFIWRKKSGKEAQVHSKQSKFYKLMKKIIHNVQDFFIRQIISTMKSDRKFTSL